MKKEKKQTKAKARKGLVGRNTTRCRTAVRNLKKSTQKEKVAIRAKNETKVKHLEQKFVKKKECQHLLQGMKEQISSKSHPATNQWRETR